MGADEFGAAPAALGTLAANVATGARSTGLRDPSDQAGKYPALTPDPTAAATRATHLPPAAGALARVQLLFVGQGAMGIQLPLALQTPDGWPQSTPRSRPTLSLLRTCRYLTIFILFRATTSMCRKNCLAASWA